MSVLLETSLGNITVDLFTDECPRASTNFLKLCKIKYYHGMLFHNVQRDYLASSGDPSHTGSGGSSIWGVIEGESKRFFDDEIVPTLKHKSKGLLATANLAPNANSSTFYFTLGDELSQLDGKHSIFGEVVEGDEVLMRINEAYCDADGMPYKNIRIRATHVLLDPFDDPPGLVVPESSPPPYRPPNGRLDDDFDLNSDDKLTEEERTEAEAAKEAQGRENVLKLLGDIPDIEGAAPPENVLFVCKLNPLTEEDALEIIFGRFGKIKKCEVIRDWKTGDSLSYAFIEYENKEACEQAYFKMDNLLIDDRRIRVDFSQSVSKLKWEWERNMQRKKEGKATVTSIYDPNVHGGTDSMRLRKGTFAHNRSGADKYKMVFDDDSNDQHHDAKAARDDGGARKRDRPPGLEDDRAKRPRIGAEQDRREDRDRYRDSGRTDRDRDRDRDRKRDRDTERDRDRDRDRNRDRGGRDDRERDSRRGRDDYGRDRDRDRDRGRDTNRSR